MREQEKLQLGAEATGLLHALRAFMQAKEGYFRTYADKMGDYMAEKKMEAEGPIWGAVEDLIERDLTTHLRNWAWGERANTI